MTAEHPTVWRGYCRHRDGGDDYADVAATSRFYALGGRETGSVFKYDDIEPFVAVHPHEVRARQIWRLREEARRDDWLLMPSRKHRRVWIGRIEGPSTESYYYRDELEPCPFPHRWRVRWLGSVSYEVARHHCGNAVTGRGALVSLDVPSTAVLDMLRRSDLRARGDGERRFWAVGADPRKYDVERAVATLDTGLWTTSGKPLDVGDGVVVWKFKGRDSWRGVVALGTVVEPPMEQSDPDEVYWRAPGAGGAPKLRARVAYEPLPRGPMALDQRADGPIADLAIARARGGSVFSVTPEQWRALREVAGAEDTQLTICGGGRRGRRQGRGLTQEEREAVERHSMQLARTHYASRWPTVQDVSRTESWDLICSDGEVLLHVEVKGTTTAGEEVIVTSNEVEAARESRTAMFIVSGIDLSRDSRGEVVAGGGRVRRIEPWVPNDDELRATQYRWSVSPQETQGAAGEIAEGA